MIVQLHTKAHDDYDHLTGLASVRKQGAPDGQLITDDRAYLVNQGDEQDHPDDYSAPLVAPKLLRKVVADLKQLNAECGQPADAYKTDDA